VSARFSTFPSLDAIRSRAAKAREWQVEARASLDRQVARAEQRIIDGECRRTDKELARRGVRVPGPDGK